MRITGRKEVSYEKKQRNRRWFSLLLGICLLVSMQLSAFAESQSAEGIPEAVTTGDMVVYQADGLLHIGRIAAVPEETVQITEEGELVINGYTQADTEVFYEKGPANGTEEQSLGKGEYYILADDPSSTEDSRSYGPILRKQIKGIVVTLIRRRNL